MSAANNEKLTIVLSLMAKNGRLGLVMTIFSNLTLHKCGMVSRNNTPVPVADKKLVKEKWRNRDVIALIIDPPYTFEGENVFRVLCDLRFDAWRTKASGVRADWATLYVLEL
jgi:hypothetical protein